MKWYRYGIIVLIGLCLIMGFDCEGGSKSHKECDLNVKATAADSLLKVHKAFLDGLSSKQFVVPQILRDSALKLLHAYPSATITSPILGTRPDERVAIDQSSPCTVVPEFTDLGVGMLFSKAGQSGPTVVDCMIRQFALVAYFPDPNTPFEAPTLCKVSCDKTMWVKWYMTLNQFIKWRDTQSDVKDAVMSTLFQYEAWMAQTGHTGTVTFSGLDYGTPSTDAYRYANCFSSSSPTDPNRRDFYIFLYY